MSTGCVVQLEKTEVAHSRGNLTDHVVDFGTDVLRTKNDFPKVTKSVLSRILFLA
jgi:hypothetical protein